ncbi:hypothetical protein [Nocardia africana]|uniref:Uncharacterized protein n=1 Tax=Nocardia africana TaxID=134964 RepID=A0ABW6NFW7_9NOCA
MMGLTQPPTTLVRPDLVARIAVGAARAAVEAAVSAAARRVVKRR